MKIDWFCRDGQTSGSVELPDRLISTQEFTSLVLLDHARCCKLGGPPCWMLFDGSTPGNVSHDFSGVEISLHVPEALPRTAAERTPVYPVILLHVQ